MKVELDSATGESGGEGFGRDYQFATKRRLLMSEAKGDFAILCVFDTVSTSDQTSRRSLVSIGVSG
jgi:hypothetical protein